MIANFWCENCTCKAVGKEKDFQFEVTKEIKKSDKITCPNSKKSSLKLLGYVTAAPVHIDKAKHAKGRTPKEREKRRIDDFKKNTLPTLNNREKAFFNKKFKAKGL